MLLLLSSLQRCKLFSWWISYAWFLLFIVFLVLFNIFWFNFLSQVCQNSTCLTMFPLMSIRGFAPSNMDFIFIKNWVSTFTYLLSFASFFFTSFYYIIMSSLSICFRKTIYSSIWLMWWTIICSKFPCNSWWASDVYSSSAASSFSPILPKLDPKVVCFSLLLICECRLFFSGFYLLKKSKAKRFEKWTKTVCTLDWRYWLRTFFHKSYHALRKYFRQGWAVGLLGSFRNLCIEI